MTFEKVKAVRDDKGRRSLVPTGEPDQHFECDDVSGRSRAGKRLPLDRAGRRNPVRPHGMPVVDR